MTTVKYFKVEVIAKGEMIIGYSATPNICRKGEPFIELYEKPDSQSTINIRVDVIDCFKVEPVFGEEETPLQNVRQRDLRTGFSIID
ncbi:hypothetical protein [Providencia sp.]|uniref:hypothetical protein n=1 Tax=Providencia sp. TaxID=589 RepID=UPI0035B3B080